MTGYARIGGAIEGGVFTCEIKSVNGRGLDIRLRLASGLDALETEIRQRIGKAISRGSVTLNLMAERDTGSARLVVNQQALESVLMALAELKGRVEATPPSLDGILSLPGVLELRNGAADERGEAMHAALLDMVSQALADLVAMRRVEGQAIARVLAERIDEIAALVDRADRHPARDRQVIADRLRQQIATLSDEIEVSPDRLAQEALLLATKADIQEELDRLRAHIAAARKLLAEGGAVGRRFDFLAQEFNREANTLCSKSNAVELTAIGLDLKAAIDQLREQVQNIE